MLKERIKKVNSLIKEELANILLKEIEFPKDAFVTVTRVETLRNFDECKVFISTFPEENWPEVIKILNKHIFTIQKKLNKKLVMRKIPKIFFVKEEKLSQAGRIEEILEKLKKEKNNV